VPDEGKRFFVMLQASLRRSKNHVAATAPVTRKTP
jgi:hypothetical protein